ncbi:MAG: cytochrome c [Hyphomonadaceae bacterium JAD_PAG50586_4]|nr:MAG: cytochrome c [Hyphomonadaceae bacterium JAD_PAG50586_4]
MRKRLFLAPLMLIILAAACVAPPPEAPPSSVGAAELGDPTLGLRYAEQSCASCHAVAAGRSLSPNPSAPAFDAVANTPGMTAIALNAWLHTPHPSMPNLIVDPDRIDDLSAYLATLKTSS